MKINEQSAIAHHLYMDSVQAHLPKILFTTKSVLFITAFSFITAVFIFTLVLIKYVCLYICAHNALIVLNGVKCWQLNCIQFYVLDCWWHVFFFPFSIQLLELTINGL